MIPVHELIKGKYLANFEFSTWVKGYFDKNFTGTHYDAVARRRDCQNDSRSVHPTPIKTPGKKRVISMADRRTPAKTRQPTESIVSID